MTSKLLSTYKQEIKELKLIPAGGGCFELSINGDLVYSKLKSGKFPDEQWAVDAVGSRLKKKRA
ncbi:MAG: SelT/SelW/SelH family protein [Planctomycetota bacterium]|nr:MAG: SelT/SelW/SelH family protein [Planctomycetota bacterium]